MNKQAFITSMLDALQKQAEDGYDAEGVDTIFGEKPGMGVPPPKPAMGQAMPSAAPAGAPPKKRGSPPEKKGKTKGAKKNDSCSMDKKAGFLDFLRNQGMAYQAMRANDQGLGQAVVSAPLFESRVNSGASTGVIAGLIGALLGGLAGGGLGTAIGEPLLLAFLGAMAGSSLGFTAGNAVGQAKADKLYLADKGITAKMPVPVRPIAMPFTLGAAVPVGSHLQYKRTELPSGDIHGSH